MEHPLIKQKIVDFNKWNAGFEGDEISEKSKNSNELFDNYFNDRTDELFFENDEIPNGLLLLVFRNNETLREVVILIKWKYIDDA